jgi:tRNA pseudouridine32 synthase/23S rRNA pseudouridine746 synthase
MYPRSFYRPEHRGYIHSYTKPAQTPMPLSQIEILYQDAALLIINKPTLLLSVPGRADDNKDCLVTRLQENGFPEARIVHRLDWETSGIIVLARDPDSHRELSRQFHDRETEKAYTALCWGLPEQDSGAMTRRLSRAMWWITSSANTP